MSLSIRLRPSNRILMDILAINMSWSGVNLRLREGSVSSRCHIGRDMKINCAISQFFLRYLKITKGPLFSTFGTTTKGSSLSYMDTSHSSKEFGNFRPVKGLNLYCPGLICIFRTSGQQETHISPGVILR